MFQIYFVAFFPMSWYKDTSCIFCYLITFAVSWILGIVPNLCHFCARTKRVNSAVHLFFHLEQRKFDVKFASIQSITKYTHENFRIGVDKLPPLSLFVNAPSI